MELYNKEYNVSKLDSDTINSSEDESTVPHQQGGWIIDSLEAMTR